MFGNTVIVLAGFLRGATIVIPAPVFDPAKVLATIPKEQCTAIYGSPSMFISLVEHPEFSKTDWKTLKKGGMGGTACPRELMKKVVDEIGVTGLTVLYGISETVGILSMTYPDDPVDIRVSTIGKPLPCYQVKIIDPASGEELPADEKGELCARGLLMKEYYKKPAATASAIDRNGWLHSGDLAKQDNNGYIQITGRLQDVIVRGGQEIYPTEVEEIIYALPQVSEVQVFPVPDKQKGEEVAAWIKIREGATLSIEEVREYCKKHLKEIQMPKYFKFVTNFPLTRTGKYQKFKLTEMATKEYGV
jgi:fatty-acyl-CoA synthase